MFDKGHRRWNAPSCVSGRHQDGWTLARRQERMRNRPLGTPLRGKLQKEKRTLQSCGSCKQPLSKSTALLLEMQRPDGLFKSQASSLCVLEHRDEARPWNRRQAACSPHRCVHSFLRSLASIGAKLCEGRVPEPSGMFLPADTATHVRLSHQPKQVETPRSLA